MGGVRGAGRRRGTGPYPGAHPRGRPFALAADVSGVRELTLRVTDGGDGDTLDHADWGCPAALTGRADRAPGRRHSRCRDRRSATYLVIRSRDRCGMSLSSSRAAARTAARNSSAGRAEPGSGSSGLAKACSSGSSECCRWRSGRPRRAVPKRSSHSP
ncbi:NPCBM/NEW2 domain-containing protein [Streptomyces sp. M19]